MSGPAPRWLSPLTIPGSWIYRLAIGQRNARLDRGVGVERLQCPVVSIGNITTGGVGKSPMTRWIASRLIERELKPVIAMRGYKALPGGKSDEQAEHEHLRPDVPIVIDADRVAGLRRFFSAGGDADVVLMDDGFQHRRLHRDLDLVLIDATADTFSQRLLPAGFLREPLENLRRANGVIVTRAASVDQILADQIQQWHGRPPIAWTRYAWTAVRVIDRGHSTIEPVDYLRDRSVVTMLGVGNPGAVIAQLRGAGVKEITSVPCRDHEMFSPDKIARAVELCDRGATLVMTLKDWLRQDQRQFDSGPIAIPMGDIEFLEGQASLEGGLMDAVASARRVP